MHITAIELYVVFLYIFLNIFNKAFCSLVYRLGSYMNKPRYSLVMFKGMHSVYTELKISEKYVIDIF